MSIRMTPSPCMRMFMCREGCMRMLMPGCGHTPICAHLFVLFAYALELDMRTAVSFWLDHLDA